MAEYISKEAVARYLKGYSEKEYNSGSLCGMVTSSVLNKAERALSEMPSADVQPVKHGKWRRIGRSRECTVCGESCICNGDWSVLSAYCPTCGAKMDLE